MKFILLFCGRSLLVGQQDISITHIICMYVQHNVQYCDDLEKMDSDSNNKLL